MFYQVTAQLKTETAVDFHRKLCDGSIRAQEQDGGEIVEAMNRAVLTDVGHVVWSEVCYCPTPLAHERATVFDQYFEAMATEEIEAYEEYEGRPFMPYLAALAKANEMA